MMVLASLTTLAPSLTIPCNSIHREYVIQYKLGPGHGSYCTIHVSNSVCYLVTKGCLKSKSVPEQCIYSIKTVYQKSEGDFQKMYLEKVYLLGLRLVLKKILFPRKRCPNSKVDMDGGTVIVPCTRGECGTISTLPCVS